ncbi:MAG: Rv3654c family TadE-like protein [Actinomycetes bacterium]
MQDEGSAGLWVLWAACLAWAVAVGAILFGGAVVARHRAAASSDLAALAAAERALYGPVPACRAAADVVAGMGASLARCTLDGTVADVSVTVRVGLPGGRSSAATVRARAGPDLPAVWTEAPDDAVTSRRLRQWRPNVEEGR